MATDEAWGRERRGVKHGLGARVTTLESGSDVEVVMGSAKVGRDRSGNEILYWHDCRWW